MMGYHIPNIDRVAHEGCVFTDYHGQQSCTAGRVAFITGQNPLRTGLAKVGMPGATLGLQTDDPTIAELLKPLGCATGTGEVEVKECPRNFFFYVSDDGGVMALRVGDYKIVFPLQEAVSTHVWCAPFTKLRLPRMFNLRRDPFERAAFNSNVYWDWLIDHVPCMYMAQAGVQDQIDNFVKYPPRQKAACFNLDTVMAQLGPAMAAEKAMRLQGKQRHQSMCQNWPGSRQRPVELESKKCPSVGSVTSDRSLEPIAESTLHQMLVSLSPFSEDEKFRN